MPVRLLCLSSSEAHSRIAQRLPPGPLPVHTRDPREALLWLREHPVDAVLVEPSGALPGLAPFLVSLTRLSAIPVVIYGGLTKSGVGDVLGMVRLCNSPLILDGFDDNPQILSRFLIQGSAAGLRLELEAALAPWLARLPLSTKRVVELSLHADHRSHSVSHYCELAGISFSTLERHVRAAGFRGTQLLMARGRVASAYYWLRDPGFTRREVALKTGYASARGIVSLLQRIIGISDLDGARTLPQSSFINMAVASLTGIVQDG